jgi:hypothetical protein
MNKITVQLQKNLCAKYKVTYLASPNDKKVGISLSAKERHYPINGLRLKPEENATGWFIWGGNGEAPTDPDFFQSLHVEHLDEWCSDVLPYLGLPPGWRFLIAPNHEDVWFDPSLLKKLSLGY